MNLNSHRKEIIKQIVTGKVYDIYSYLEAFGYLEEYKINVDEAINKFEEDEKNITYKIPNYEGEFEKSELKAYIAMKNQIILKMIFYMLKQDILLILQVLLYHLTIKNFPV